MIKKIMIATGILKQLPDNYIYKDNK